MTDTMTARHDTSITVTDDGLLEGYCYLRSRRSIHGAYADGESALRFVNAAGWPGIPLLLNHRATDPLRDIGGALLAWDTDDNGLHVAVRLQGPAAGEIAQFLKERQAYFCPEYGAGTVHHADGYVSVGEFWALSVCYLSSFPRTCDETTADYLECLAAAYAPIGGLDALPAIAYDLVNEPLRKPGDPLTGVSDVTLPHEGVTAPPALPVPVGTPPGTLPVLEWSTSLDFETPNYTGLASPMWADKTPSDLSGPQIQQVIADLADLSVGATPAYLLANDGTPHSAVWYASNVRQAIADWSKGANLNNQYTLLRLTDTPGQVVAYCPATSVSGWKRTFDFRASPFSAYWSIEPPSMGNTFGHFVAGQGYVGDTNPDGDQGVVEINATGFGTAALTRVDTIYTASNVTTNPPDAEENVTSTPFGTRNDIHNGTTLVNTDTGSSSTSSIHLSTNAGNNAYSPTAAATIVAAVIYGTGSCPFDFCDGGGTGTGDVLTAVSTDFGATWNSPVTVASGGSPGIVGGFDAQHAGTVLLAAQTGKVRKSTNLGTSWSDETHGDTTGTYPLCIVLPWYTLGSNSSLNTGSSPDYILASAAAVSGASLWGVTSGGGKHDWTPTAGFIIAGPNACTIWKGTKIAVLGTVSGVMKLYVGTISAGLTVTWASPITVNASYIRGAYQARAAGPLFMAGLGGSWFSNNFGGTIHARTGGVAGPLGIEPAA